MKFVANGVKYELDQDRMTFAEGKAIEKASGHTMGQIKKSGGDDLASVQAFVWVAMKRQDPTLKFEDLEDMAIGDVEWIDEEPVEGDEPPDPMEAADAADGVSSSTA